MCGGPGKGDQNASVHSPQGACGRGLGSGTLVPVPPSPLRLGDTATGAERVSVTSGLSEWQVEAEEGAGGGGQREGGTLFSPLKAHSMPPGG